MRHADYRAQARARTAIIIAVGLATMAGLGVYVLATLWTELQAALAPVL